MALSTAHTAGNTCQGQPVASDQDGTPSSTLITVLGSNTEVRLPGCGVDAAARRGLSLAELTMLSMGTLPSTALVDSNSSCAHSLPPDSDAGTFEPRAPHRAANS